MMIRYVLDGRRCLETSEDVVHCERDSKSFESLIRGEVQTRGARQ